MNKLLALGLSLPLVACVVGSDTDTPAPTPGGSGGSNTGTGTGTDSAKHIATNTMWSGTVDVAGQTVVDPSITLTIAAGTTVKFGPGAGLMVNGTVDVQGSKAQVVNLVPSTAGGHFSPTSVKAGGELKMNYAVQTGGGIEVEGGKITVTNTRMSQAEGDFLVVLDGSVDVSYSAIGLEPGGGTDSTHCDLHFGGSPTSIKVTHSNISSSTGFGLMLYAGNGVDLTYNNWFNNPTQIQTMNAVTADISYGWFDSGAPMASAGGMLTYTSPAPSRLPAAMAGPQ